MKVSTTTEKKIMSSNSPDPVDKIVGTNVRALREIRGMSQKELAAAIGVAFQQVQKYEGASNRISASRMVQIAGALRVPVGKLFDGVKGGDTDPIEKVNIQLVRALQKLKPSTRTAVATLIHNMADSGG
jgi:transcriptional regulator with XRE-family HTH domain